MKSLADFSEEFEKQENSTLVLDFDGVIHKNSKGFHDGTIYDDPVEGTKEALDCLSKKYTLVISTCKASSIRPLIKGETGIILVWKWLIKHGLDKYIYEVTSEKVRAAFYIDDKGIRFTTWEETLNDIDRFERGS